METGLISGNTEVPGGQIGSGIAQVVNNDRTVNYLLHAQNRRDKLALIEAQQAALKRKAEAEALKEKEEARKAAAYEVLQGEEWRKALQWPNDRILAETKAFISNPANSAYDIREKVNEYNRITKAHNAFATNQKERMDAVDADAEKNFYRRDPLARVGFVNRAAQDNDFYKGDYVPDYARMVMNPDNFDANAAGSALLKDNGKMQVKVKNSEGKQEDWTWDDILNQPTIVGKDKIQATISRSKAENLINSNPVTKDWYERYVGQEIDRNPNMTAQQASKDAIDKLFKGKATVNYSRDDESTATKTRNEKLGDITTKTYSMNAPVSYLPVGGDRQRSVNGSFGQFEGKSTTKPIEISANKTVYPMNLGAIYGAVAKENEAAKAKLETKLKAIDNAGLGKEATNKAKADLIKESNIRPVKQQYDELISRILTKNSDGSYTLNYGSKTQNWGKSKEGVYVLTRDVPVKMTSGETVVRPAGTPLPPSEANIVRNRMGEDAVVKRKMFVFSPTQMQVGDDDELIKNPALKQLQLFVPAEEGSEFEMYHTPTKTKGAIEW